MRRPDLREEHSEAHSWGQTIERLDRVSKAMNPFLLFVAALLVVLNLACIVNLIDWRDPAPGVASAAAPETAAGTADSPVATPAK